MKTWKNALLAALSVTFVLSWATAQTQMIIKMRNGQTITLNTADVQSVQFSAGAAQTTTAPAAGAFGGVNLPFNVSKTILADDLSKGLNSNWRELQVVGGNFSKFATFSSGHLVVNVPAGNSWGKTGILSKAPAFKVDATPVTVLVKLDPSQTTGFVLGLASVPEPDVWVRPNVWLSTVRPSESADYASISLLNTQGAKEAYAGTGEIPVEEDIPAWLALRISTGKAELYLPGQPKAFTLPVGWLTKGTDIYLHLFTHPAQQGGPARLAVDGIYVGK